MFRVKVAWRQVIIVAKRLGLDFLACPWFLLHCGLAQWNWFASIRHLLSHRHDTIRVQVGCLIPDHKASLVVGFKVE